MALVKTTRLTGRAKARATPAAQDEQLVVKRAPVRQPRGGRREGAKGRIGAAVLELSSGLAEAVRPAGEGLGDNKGRLTASYRHVPGELSDLGGLVRKAGLVEPTKDDRATL